MIRTKILATMGPAASSPRILRELLAAGCGAFRLNFSHGRPEQHAEYLANVRAVEKETAKPIVVIADLCGPKIRVGPMRGGGALLCDGQEVTIQRHPIEGCTTRISTTLGELVDDVSAGDTILLDDGKLRLTVVKVNPPDEIICRVEVGGILSSGKGVNLPNTNLRLSALTEKDGRDVAWIAEHEIDYVALSFVQRAEDIQELRNLLQQHGSEAKIIAKIEKPQALEHLDAILDVADAVMVARGDLGVEMDFSAVPVAQKRIAAAAQRLGKPCIIATQMLESMIESPTPTRAEVSDVANAVMDCTDVVMLSGETAVGKYPAETVGIMNQTVEAIQEYQSEVDRHAFVHAPMVPTTAAITHAMRAIMSAEPIKAVVVFSASGDTARMAAKNRPPCPILAFAPTDLVVRQMCLYYGVIAKKMPVPEHTSDFLQFAEPILKQMGLAETGDRILVLTGRPLGSPGRTNSLIVHVVGETC